MAHSSQVFVQKHRVINLKWELCYALNDILRVKHSVSFVIIVDFNV